ncbi:MAG: homoserine dehydrogenase [Methanomicrobiales archaeon]|nr:homoserine dehydrogenase [Methanomicrobiales archaeon]
MKVAILGFGSVGQGVARMIREKNLGLSITAIADSRSGLIDNKGINPEKVLAKKREGLPVGSPDVTARSILTTGDYDTLVEVTPTNITSGEPATTHIRTALERGKHVVTSNKGPIALHHRELCGIAASRGVALRYEATVCGAIPLIHVLEHDLMGNEIRALHGIMNGTCNYILTRMSEEGLTYDQALAEARQMGYAEADPTYDVKGIDSAIKLVIFANTIWDWNARFSDVEITGIDQLTPDALRLAEEDDATIRLIAEAIPARRLLRVSPRILPRGHPLVVRGTLNAVTLEADMAGSLTFIGKGAGSIETASAIIGDLLFIKEKYDRCSRKKT